MKNSEIRAWYRERVAEISALNQEWIAGGIGLQERALRAWQIRRDAKVKARSMMENAAEIEDLRERDRLLYGNVEGPTFIQLVEANKRRGLSGAEVYEQIIRGSQVTNPGVNRLFDTKEPPP
jgi:hypothetical protein